VDEIRTKAPRDRRKRGAILSGIVLLALAIGAGAIYGIAPSHRNGESACPGAAATATRLSPLAKGEVAALNVSAGYEPLAPLSFKRPDGRTATLADFRGKTVLLNLWATWCVPCRTEMPALDRLQASMGGDRFEVVPVNIDSRNPDRAERFLDEIDVRSLTRYSDPTTKIFSDLKQAGLAFGMPTTLLLNGDGCVLASIAGPADWASEDAKAFVRAALGG
jgi:thiol-disulfide isomerase/thioredoxin